MPEENIPELFHPQKKERKIPSKKQYRQYAQDFLEINPQMNPDEIVKRTKRYIEGPNPFKSPEENHLDEIAAEFRKVRLRKLGYNPNEWTYYGIPLQPEKGWDTPFTEKDLERAHIHLPESIELLVVQGHIEPASETDRNQGREFYDMSHFWDAYIRIKPTVDLISESKTHQEDSTS